MIVFDSEYFNILDTLDCGQVFRFFKYNKGYFLLSKNKACYLTNDITDELLLNNYDGNLLPNKTYLLTNDDDYFYNYFNLATDYKKIVDDICGFGYQKVNLSCQTYKGIRILKQDKEEGFLSFVISQNNNIPRIKGIIEKLSKNYGKPFEFLGETFYSFPTAKELSTATIKDLTECGLGYRADYIYQISKDIVSGKLDLNAFNTLSTTDLKKALLLIKGVGTKVCNCVTLFAYNRFDSFPVDTWIEKIYHEDFNGTLTDCKKITEYFLDIFKDYSGYVQQYLFYAKRKGLI